MAHKTGCPCTPCRNDAILSSLGVDTIAQDFMDVEYWSMVRHLGDVFSISEEIMAIYE